MLSPALAQEAGRPAGSRGPARLRDNTSLLDKGGVCYSACKQIEDILHRGRERGLVSPVARAKSIVGSRNTERYYLWHGDHEPLSPLLSPSTFLSSQSLHTPWTCHQRTVNQSKSVVRSRATALCLLRQPTNKSRTNSGITIRLVKGTCSETLLSYLYGHIHVPVLHTI